MTALPLVVVGAGSIGQRHIDVATISPAIDLCAVVEPKSDLRERLSKCGLPMVADIDDVPTHAKAAIIATPTADHTSSASRCLDRGMCVLVEKPIAQTIRQASDLIAQSLAHQLPLFVGHHRRCHSFVINAREKIADLGDLVGVQGLWSLRKHDTYYDTPWRTQPGAGPLMTNLSHEVDLLQVLMGNIVKVTALTSSRVRGFNVEDTASVAFEFSSGALGSFLISDAGLSPWAFETGTNENPNIAPSDQDYLRITGTQGALALPSLTGWHANGAIADWTQPLTKTMIHAAPTVDPLLEQINRFANVVSGGQDDVLCTGQAGLAALSVILATAYSAQRNQPIGPHDVPLDFDGT